LHTHAALFTVAKPRCPTTDECIKKMWHMYTMVHYSAIKKNEIVLFAGKWMEPEIIMVSKVSQVQKNEGHVFSLICRS
jgi:hypothetical protein